MRPLGLGRTPTSWGRGVAWPYGARGCGMRFADPTSCPECRGVIAGEQACPHCGFDLMSVEARELWQALLHADVLLARAAHRPRATEPSPTTPTTPTAA